MELRFTDWILRFRAYAKWMLAAHKEAWGEVSIPDLNDYCCCPGRRIDECGCEGMTRRGHLMSIVDGEYP